MRALRRLTAGLAIAAVAGGCVYGFTSLPATPPDTELATARVPLDAAAEARRRASRRRWALIAGVIELGLGAAVAAAAAASDDRENELFLDFVAQTAIAAGAGDVGLAAIDLALATPFTDAAGAFRSPVTSADPDVPPSPRLQADAGAGLAYQYRRSVETHVELGVFHWVRPTLRLRYAVRVDRGTGIDERDELPVYYGAGAAATLEWNPGRRRHWGRHAQSALVVTAAPRGVWSPDDDRARFGWRAGAGWAFGRAVVGAGASQVIGLDDAPVLEVWLVVRPVSTD